MTIDIKLISDVASIASGLSALILAVLTAIYVVLTRKIVESQTDPCVILTVVHDCERPTTIQLVAKNIGTGLAKDVQFSFSRPLPASAFGLSVDTTRTASEMSIGPLITGIPALGPGESRTIDWGQYGGLKRAIGDVPIIATCSFKKGDKLMKPTVCPLEVDSFVGTVANESNAAKVVKELGKMADDLRSISSNVSKLAVSKSDRVKSQSFEQ